jgi:hypothetical protein
MATVCHVVVALIVVGVLIWAGSSLLLDAWWGRHRVDLADRLMPFQAARRGPTLARSTELSGRARQLGWISMTDAATRLRLSRSGFVGLAQREGIYITERSGGAA